MAADTVPDRLGSIRIDGVLGQGGMGTVYVGYDEALQRKVALKTLRGALRGDRERAWRRFQREARVLSRLEHPHVCRIHGYLQHEGQDVLVLEYVEGATLQRHIAGGLLERRHRLSIAVQIAEALEAAHAQGIVHRDLKPDNVMITPEGQVKVLDFGLARVAEAPDGSDATTGEPSAPAGDDPAASTGASAARLLEDNLAPDGGTEEPLDVTIQGAILGTPLYMSPEQAAGRPAGTASDLFSFGLLLNALWTGQPPHPPGLGGREIVRRVREGQVTPADSLPGDLLRLVERLLQPAPAARATAVEALQRLHWIVDRPARLARRAVTALVLVALVAAAVKYTVDLRHERGLAEQQRRLADLRRGQAEELITFMLGDLREKLTSVGRLQILDDVGDRALAYFAAVPDTELSLGELSVRAQALYQIGDVRTEQGDLAAAMEAFRAAVTTGEELVARAPDDVQALMQLGYSHFWLGSGHWNDGDLDQALASFSASRDVARQLVAAEPDNPQWQLELAAEESNVARVLQEQGDLAGATTVLEQRLETLRQIAASDPERLDWQVELATSHLLLGMALEEAGAAEQALEHYRADLEGLTLVVARAPDDVTLRERLATSHSHLAAALESLGRRDEAAPHFEAHRALGQELADVDGDNTSFQDQLAAGLASAGIRRRDRGELAAGAEALGRALAIYEDLLSRDPERQRWQIQTGRMLIELGLLGTLQGAHQEALAQARRSAGLLAGMAWEGPGQDQQSLLGRAALVEGRALRGLGDDPAAVAAFQRAQAAVQGPGVATDSTGCLEVRARALLQLDRRDEARPLLQLLDDRGFSNPQLEALRGDA